MKTSSLEQVIWPIPTLASEADNCRMTPNELEVGKLYWIPVRNGRIRVELLTAPTDYGAFVSFYARRVRVPRSKVERDKGWTTWGAKKFTLLFKKDFDKVEETTL